MTEIERRYVESLCLAAAATAEALIPDSGMSREYVRRLAVRRRVEAMRLEEVGRGR